MVAAGLLCVVLGNLFQLSGPQFLKRGIDSLAAGRPLRTMVVLALALIVVAILTGAARYAMRQLLNGVSRRIETDIRQDLYTHLERLEPAFYWSHPTGDLMALATNDLGAVRMVAGPAIMYLTETITRLAMAIPLMGHIDWRLTALGLVPMFGVPGVIVLLGPALEKRFGAVQAHFGTLTNFAHENLSGCAWCAPIARKRPRRRASRNCRASTGAATCTSRRRGARCFRWSGWSAGWAVSSPCGTAAPWSSAAPSRSVTSSPSRPISHC